MISDLTDSEFEVLIHLQENMNDNSEYVSRYQEPEFTLLKRLEEKGYIRCKSAGLETVNFSTTDTCSQELDTVTQDIRSYIKVLSQLILDKSWIYQYQEFTGESKAAQYNLMHVVSYIISFIIKKNSWIQKNGSIRSLMSITFFPSGKVDFKVFDKLYKRFVNRFNRDEVLFALHFLEVNNFLIIQVGSDGTVEIFLLNPYFDIRKGVHYTEIIKGANTNKSFVNIKRNENSRAKRSIKPFPNKKFLESDLESILLEDLSVIEDGLELIGSQHEVENGFIDILARDKNGILCVIELKIKDNDKNIIYQSVYYPTQFDERVRMITIAPDYNNKIYTSLMSLGVEMKTYYFENRNIKIIDYKKGIDNSHTVAS